MIDLPVYPFMNPPEVEAMDALLRERRPRRVLEWGAGGSTLYYPTHCPAAEWITIEHDPAYVEALAGRLPPNVELRLMEFPRYQRPQFEKKFDLIIVDGRMRVRCLDAARELLAEGGLVVLHDAGRARYDSALAFYRKSQMIVPPTPTKDPRGLRIFSCPVADLDPLPAVTAARGVMYLCWGDPAAREIDASLESLWAQAPGIPAVIVGDQAAADHFAGRDGVQARVLAVDPFIGETTLGFHAGRVKPLLAGLSPFEQTLYVDADTVFKRDPAVGFDLLARWDFIIAEADTRSLAQTFSENRSEASQTAKWVGTPHILYHNSGMFFWRRGPTAMRLFRLWAEEWAWHSGWDEQIALLRALLNSDVLFLNVPYTWNSYAPAAAFFIHHRFGSQAARKFRSMARSLPVRGRGVPLAPTRPLVRVEVAPGRFVKAHAGDEEKVLEHFRRTQSRRTP